jgi:hypothetical protein
MTTLLQQLAGDGTIEARGGFTIDPDKAREKLRHYQLAEPQRYVLLLAEAAVSSGATRLDFEIDSDDLHLRFDGASFHFEQLENIYGSLFASIGEVDVDELARLRGLQQLAFAINSAMALNPRFVRVVSVDAEGHGARLELRPDAADQVERLEPGARATPASDGPQNWVHVKDRFRPGLVLEFFRSLRGNLAEIALLREHCRWSRVPVFVNRKLISGPIEFDREHWTAVDVFDPPSPEHGERIGRAALGVLDDRGALERLDVALCSNGVFIERATLPGSVRGFTAIVDSPRFGKDVSQVRLLRDSNFTAVMRAIREAQDRAILRLAERCTAQTGPAWSATVFHEWLRFGQFGGLRRALRENPTFAAVAEVPLWPVVGAANISTRALIECEDALHFATADFEFAPVDVPFVLALAVDDGRVRHRLLDKLFPGRLRDYTAALRREHERQRKRLEFMARKHLPELSEGHFMIRETIRAQARDGERVSAIRGELGLRAIGQRESWVRLLAEGCLLEEVRVDGPIPGLCAVVSAEFTPTEDYDRARSTPVQIAAVIAVLEGLLAGLTKLAASGVITVKHTELRDLMRGYVHELTRADYGQSFLEHFGYTAAQARRQFDGLRRRGELAITPAWQLDASAGERHPIAELPLYGRIRGRPRSLAELHERVAAGERLYWLEAGTGLLPVVDVEVLLLEQADREALRTLLGAEVLEPFAEQLAWIRRRDAFLDRPTTPLTLPRPTLLHAGVRSENLRGELGLREFGFEEVNDGKTPVRVLFRERELCELTLELPLPGLCAWVESAEFEVTAGFDGLAHPLTLRRPLLHALVGLVQLVLGRALREPRDQPRELRHSEWWLLAMVPNLVLGRGGLSAAFLQLRKAEGQAKALAELDGLLALLERFPERDLERVLGRLRGRDQLPTAAVVGEALKRPSRRPSEAEVELAGFRRGLLALLDALLELPLLRRFTGAVVDGRTPRSLTLAAQLDRVAAGRPLAWVGEDVRVDVMPELDFEVLGLDSIEQHLLADLLGAQSLEFVGEWLRGRAQFERRRTIDEVRVPRGAALTILAVAGEGWRGELGIVREPPRQAGRSKIRVFTRGREAALVDLPARPLAIVGALAFDELALTERHDDITMLERERIRRVVEGHTEDLIRDLAARFAGLEGAEKLRAAEIIRHLLASWPPGRGGYAARANHRRPLFRLLADLPVFAGARKPWSAVELADARERGQIATVAYRKPSVRLPDIPVVVLDAADVEFTIRELFGETRDLYRELEQARALEARKAAAPRLPSAPPNGALAQIEVDGEGLRGWLWISPGHTEVLFGGEGRVVERRTISPACPCAGAVSGERLNINAEWTRVILSRSQDRLLERLAVELWTALLDEFIRQSEGAGLRTSAERQRHVSSRDSLHGLFMRLHASYGRGRSRTGKRKRKQQGNRYERLYGRACAAPLLELSNGRWISADVAERERPIELANLELWTGPSAEELAHQRAVERREAERARAEQRQAEAERRRLEAAAREREAERRRRADREARRRAEAAAAERRQAAAEQAAAEQEAAEQAAAPSAEQLLLEAVREELRLVRARNRGLVSNRILDSLILGEPVRRASLFRHTDGTTQIDPGHRLFRAVLDGYLADPGLLSLLASAAYSYLNVIHREIEDADEAEFLRLHAGYVMTSTANAETDPD